MKSRVKGCGRGGSGVVGVEISHARRHAGRRRRGHRRARSVFARRQWRSIQIVIGIGSVVVVGIVGVGIAVVLSQQ